MNAQRFNTCPYCRENHDPARGLSFDGYGVNGCDLYRSRWATLTTNAPADLGAMMAAAPDAFYALRLFVAEYEGNGHDDREQRPEMKAARAALAKVNP